ncbi:hypothetical protein E4U52_004660 [Claviceps spartinae]|nr:hypothetical protein E4U52_004660 [Claviceps spartinae]
MTRKPRNKRNPLAAEAKVENYDIIASQRALMKNGFHKAVTSKTPQEIEFAWLSRYKHIVEKPSKSEFKSQAPFRSCGNDSLLVKLMNAVDVGGNLANVLFAEGLGTVLNAAVASSSSWLAMSNSVKIWDMNAATFRANGRSGVLLAVTPECTVGEMKHAHDLNPCGLHTSTSSWCAEAMKLENDIYLSIHLVHRRLRRWAGNRPQRQDVDKILPVEFLAEEIVSIINRIQDVATVWSASQFVSSPRCRLFDPPAIFSMSRLRDLLSQILLQQNSFKVLYLQKIAYLDRRLVSIILRACPNVRMLGIYECPLIHFGDVLCLIDLIYEVNYDRRKRGMTEVTGLDFYPNYNKGTPFASDTTATFGLSWAPLKLDVAQRGFFNIILKAFMKAKRMKLGLLFDQDKAFCTYLNQIPNYPLAVPTFLDAMYRYADARHEPSRQTILYDLLKPVRLGLERYMDQDWSNYYSNVMGKHMVFCSSCGYETLEEFYSQFALHVPHPHRRRCAGCTLQRWLDGEVDHLKTQKRQILDTLFPDWHGTDFNQDAPVLSSMTGLLRLQSTKSVRPDVPRLLLDSNGEMYCPKIKEAFVRDNKSHLDSLQHLPSLSELLHGLGSVERWAHVYSKCNNLDMYSRSVRKVQESSIRHDDDKGIMGGCADGGMPDHVEELQPGAVVKDGVPCLDFEAAATLLASVARKGWSGYN